MYLAYLDDSDTKAKTIQWQVMAGVLFDPGKFKYAEVGFSNVRELLKKTGNLEKFDEFHACELYGGYGAFEGIEQSLRFEAIRRLLTMVRVVDAHIVYGAVDIERLRSEIFGSADPQDICFRICLGSINDWTSTKLFGSLKSTDAPSEEAWAEIADEWISEMVLVIADECSDKKLRDTLQRTYRNLRPPRKSYATRLYHLHDDMYFGDSRFSVGIQLADLCSYFIARHLEADAEISSFYEMIRPHIVAFEIYPEPIAKTDYAEAQMTLEEQPVSGLRPDDGQVVESPAQQSQRRIGSGESSQVETITRESHAESREEQPHDKPQR